MIPVESCKCRYYRGLRQDEIGGLTNYGGGVNINTP